MATSAFPDRTVPAAPVPAETTGLRTADRAVARRYGAKLATLRRRAEFLRLRGGQRWSGPAFLIEGKPRDTSQKIEGPRFGFTITKKIGKAHERNRMRRRLSHALRTVAVAPALTTWDFVIVARAAALTVPFDGLVRDFTTALDRIARGGAPPIGTRKKPPPASLKP